jgi:hypothetical protein
VDQLRSMDQVTLAFHLLNRLGYICQMWREHRPSKLESGHACRQQFHEFYTVRVTNAGKSQWHYRRLRAAERVGSAAGGGTTLEIWLRP